MNHKGISWLGFSGTSAALTFMVLLLAVLPPTAAAQTFNTILSFSGSNGSQPWAGPIVVGGNLYGTTAGGGKYGYGVVYELTSSGQENVLYSFTGSNDGGVPFAGVITDPAGNLYGTTAGGGSSNQGVAFEIDTAGNEKVLHSFKGGSTDGCVPGGGLVEYKGELYGTTQSCGASNHGTVFKVSKNGNEKVLHSFAGSDGAVPALTSLIVDKAGTFYGVTNGGGASGYGVVYKMTASGKVTVLHSFAGGSSDGCYASGTPALDKNGNLFGTTQLCGSADSGIIWRVSKQGKETVLHNFAGGPADGVSPAGGVVLDSKGNLYGDTLYGGAGYGTVFEFSKGAITLLHSFANSDDGANPIGSLFRASNGDLYGMASVGGSGGWGTVWSITY